MVKADLEKAHPTTESESTANILFPHDNVKQKVSTTKADDSMGTHPDKTKEHFHEEERQWKGHFRGKTRVRYTEREKLILVLRGSSSLYQSCSNSPDH